MGHAQVPSTYYGNFQGHLSDSSTRKRYLVNAMTNLSPADSTFTGLTHPGVSVILPILNEEAHLRQAVASILGQKYLGELEIILAVGPSKDRTLAIAQELAAENSALIVVENPTGRTATALNLAIGAARFPIICRIDGHAQIAPSYIAQAVELLRSTNAVNVGGIMFAQGRTPFERSVATAMKSALGVGSASFHTGGTAGPADTVYLGTFRKTALQQVGGYDERFTRAQDWELNYRLRQAGGVIWFDPQLVVKYQPRSNFKTLTKQYFEYGRWRRAVIRNHQNTVNYRYLAPPIAVSLFTISVIAGLFIHPFLYLPALGYLSLLLVGAAVIGKSWQEKIILPSVLMAMHFSWGIGFILSPRTLIPKAE